MVRNETGGWHWSAFFLGPFWYLSKGMISKGIWLLVLCVVTIFTASPFVLFYCGAKGKGDWYSYRLREKSKINFNNL